MLNTEFCIDLLENNIKMENDINNHNICVVGAGNWGRNHIRTLYQLNSLAALVENNCENGLIKIPEVLHSFTGFKTIKL